MVNAPNQHIYTCEIYSEVTQFGGENMFDADISKLGNHI